MYTCPLCEKEYPYLILEYDLVVCEQCSLNKNFSPEDLKSFEQVEAQMDAEDADDVIEEEIGNDDAKQLFDLIEKIENPKIREDFIQLAQEYLSGID